MSIFAENKADNFANPTELPDSQEEREKWLEANQKWWETNPMRYDWLGGKLDKIPYAEFSKEFYREIDSRFFANANEYLPLRKIPFDGLIDFESLKDKKVLEIGVGNGSHAQLLATYAGDFTGIDLTDYGVKSTIGRMKVFGLDKAKIIQMNAEDLQFESESFDFVWSWGVIHHSANPRRILEEINRVLKPGGTFKAMVYYRSFWSYYAFGLLAGIGKGYFFKGDSFHESVQKITDGAIARYYSLSEWRAEIETAGLKVENIRVLGAKSAILPIPGNRLKYKMLDLVPNPISRFMTNNLRMGSFVVSEAKKA
ncbi:MAG TPA: methyltransferase domain-containing protein [Pyrinomonadaceae bacterium]|jgi:ubiquinone/menaquinone biosynthesis C-methylase UbiE